SGYRDKVGIVSDSQTLPDFADWAEQLIAESTGKEEKGILPIVLQANSFELSAELSDVVLVSVSENESFRPATEALVTGTIAEQFLLWEYATAVASRLIQVNPFDQPDVESAKIAARGMLAEKSKSKPPLFTDGGVMVLAEGLNLEGSTTLEQALELLLSQVGEQSYVAVHAYLNREAQLPSEKLRNLLAEKLARPVTFGWGPRFLHSTGQYHKGGPRTGVYLQLTSQTENDISVPGREFSFGELITSQAAGDAKVLADLGRPVLTLVLGDVQKDFDRVISIIEGSK
ncbi:MAG: glucose-6-phosphate isomerase, partial [Acidobacteria bacterium]|nr:glucose-6-phosphate isomerase [Acidobacteriota bacterium]